MDNFGALNWSILVVYILANLLLGFVLSKRVESAEDFYLGRRETPWWAIGISVVATYVSALSFLGGPAWSYTEGMSVVLIHMNYPLVIVLVITLFLPFFYNSGCASIYEYQERRFGPTSRSVISVIFLVSHSFGTAAILYATSLVLQFITGIDVVTAIVVVTIIALVYTTMGGITAVIWTDVIQAFVLLAGAGIVFYALLNQLPAPLGEVLSQLKAAGKTDPLDFSVDVRKTTTVWAGIFAMTIYHVTVYGVNQMMAQRTLAAKTIGDAKKSYLLMGFISPWIYFAFIFLGILLFAYYEGREFDNGNTIILQFAADYGLPGLMGIIAAAVMAASMSTLDSSFNSMATVTTVDFYQKYFRRHESEAHYLKASRMFTLMWAFIIVFPAILFSQSEGSILETLSKVGSYFVGAKLAMYGLGFFSKHTSERGLLIGVAVGFVVLWIVAANTQIAWPWYCLIGAGVNILVSVPASILLDGRQAEWSDYSIPGQFRLYAEQKLPQKADGWYVVPGKLDSVSKLLLVYFVACMLALYLFNRLI
ncbi:MAG: sodium/solute symporter [Pseudomonadota bacterium]